MLLFKNHFWPKFFCYCWDKFDVQGPLYTCLVIQANPTDFCFRAYLDGQCFSNSCFWVFLNEDYNTAFKKLFTITEAGLTWCCHIARAWTLFKTRMVLLQCALFLFSDKNKITLYVVQTPTSKQINSKMTWGKQVSIFCSTLQISWLYPQIQHTPGLFLMIFSLKRPPYFRSLPIEAVLKMLRFNRSCCHLPIAGAPRCGLWRNKIEILPKLTFFQDRFHHRAW